MTFLSKRYPRYLYTTILLLNIALKIIFTCHFFEITVFYHDTHHIIICTNIEEHKFPY